MSVRPLIGREGLGMKTVDAVDGEVRFTAEWGGQTRYVFIPGSYVSDDAGRNLSRDEAVEYVSANLERYRVEAQIQHGDESAEKIVILARGSLPSSGDR